jgi:MYXO-CTERM domain-containing protein
VTSVGILRNNLAYSNDGHGLLADMTHGGPISDEYNSWDANLGLKVTDADFQRVAFAPPASCPAAYAPGGTRCCAPTDATCFAGMAGARGPDGSLPAGAFLRLASTSMLIDRGTNVGLPFAGSAPDLGCFETGLAYDPSDGGASGGGNASDAATAGNDAGASSGAGDDDATVSDGSGGSSGGGGASGGQGSSTSGGGAGDAASSSKGGCSCRVTRDEQSQGETGVASLVALGAMLALRRRRNRA